MSKLKSQTPLDIAIILIVFAVTGSTAALIPKYLMPLLSVEKGSFWYYLLYVLLITPIYQVLLLAYAFIFGKFDYFYSKQKKIFQWIGKQLGLYRPAE